MKILFVLTYYRPHWTGLTQYAARLAEGLSKSKHNVQVLCSRHKKELPLEEEISGVKVFRLPYIFKFLRSVIMPKFPLELWKKIKENDTIVVYLPLQEVFLVALFCKLQNKKLFLVHNGDLVLPSECGFFCRIIEKIYYLTTSFAIKQSNSIIVQTEDYSKSSKLLSNFKKKWKVILPLFELPEIDKEDVNNFIPLRENPGRKPVGKSEDLSLRRDFAPDEARGEDTPTIRSGSFIIAKNLVGKKLIGFSGRFVEEKGIDYLLEAIPKVIKAIPTAHFVFAGDYKIQYEDFFSKISPLIENYKEYISLLGLIKEKKEIFAFYRSLEVYVQPSRTDCFPSSQIEALLCGTPSVCTNIPGARWVVKETGMGEIVKPKEAKALAEGIIKVIKERKKYLKNSDKLKKIFDYQKTLSDYEELFRKD